MKCMIQEVSSVQKIRILNAYRLYLQILYLRDITTPNGIESDNNYLIGVKI